MSVTASWSWRRSDAEPPIEITEAHLARFRTLRVSWEAVEAGAAALRLPDDADPLPDDFDRALEVFLQAGSLESWAGTVRIPEPGDEADELADIPDPQVRALFLRGGEVAFEASDDETTLWQEANLRAEGIDPKRPFGTGNVARDVQRIIDPEEKLSKRALAARIAILESRMALMLQFFVQSAALATGIYERGTHGGWRRMNGESRPAESLDADAWYGRLSRQFTAQSRAFTETAMHLQALVWDGRVPGEYADWVQRFRLHDLYEDFEPRFYEGTTLEIASAAHEAFGLPIFGAMAARVLNARGEFQDALRWLETIDRLEIPPERADLASLSYPNLCVLEGLVARYGASRLSWDAYESALAGQHPLTEGRSPYPWVHDLLMERAAPSEQAELWHHCRAVCAQVHLMRGPASRGEPVEV